MCSARIVCNYVDNRAGAVWAGEARAHRRGETSRQLLYAEQVPPAGVAGAKFLTAE